MKQIIYLEYKDNIATIRDKLERAQGEEVVLVVPRRYAVLRDLVNLKLLKRYAQNLAIDLALVVRDGETRTLAREVGFPLLSSVDSSRQLNLRGLLGPRTSAVPRERTTPERAPTARRNSWGRLLSVLVLFVLLFAFSAAFVYLVLPAASLELTPATEPVSARMEIVAVPGLANIDYSKGQIPATTVSVELQGAAEAPASAKRDLPDTRAAGSVVFANKSREAVTIPKGTIVRTSSGTPIRFYTLTDIKLPATFGAHERVNVIAVDAGPMGNVKPLTINQVEGELSFRVDVINDDVTLGGGFKQVGVISAEDQAQLKNALLERLQQEAYAKLKSQLLENEFIPADTVKVQVQEEKFDKAVGDAGEKLGLRLAIRASGTLVGGEEANLLMLRMLEQQVQEGYALLPTSLRFRPGEVLAVEGSSVRFRMEASGMSVNDINEADVRTGLGGKPTEEAFQYLLDHWDFDKTPQLEISPAWVGRVPYLAYRINVKVVRPEGR